MDKIKPYEIKPNEGLPDYAKSENIENKILPSQLSTIVDKYLIKNENDQRIETINDLFYRVASHVAKADSLYNENLEKTTKSFYELMSSFKFLPNSPTLMNAGRDLGQLSACFVLPIEDSMEGILDTLKNTGLIHMSGGGTGFSFKDIRPSHEMVRSTKGVSSGPRIFLDVYNGTTEGVKQGGTRRGANMGILPIYHPDIYEWIFAKPTEDDVTNFNLSIGLDDNFMEKLEKNDYITLIDPRTNAPWNARKVFEEEKFNQQQKKILDRNYSELKEKRELLTLPSLYKKDDNQVYCRYIKNKPVGFIKDDEVYLSTQVLFENIIKLIHKNGEPGVIFLDTLEKSNPTPHIGVLDSTNPCGEQPLLPYESCNLGSINLDKVVKGGKIDYGELESIVKEGVHFLDNVIDVNKYSLTPKEKDLDKIRSAVRTTLSSCGVKENLESKIEEILEPYKIGPIEKMTKANRKIGLGVMGFADMLIQLNIPYDSEAASKIAGEIMGFIEEKAIEASVELAAKRGVFPNWKGSIYDPESEYFKGEHLNLRNATLTTIAPTGTLSLAAGCSSGAEPIFEVDMNHTDAKGTSRKRLNPHLEEKIGGAGIAPGEVIYRIMNGESLQKMILPQHIKNLFKIAREIDYASHIKIQAEFQKYTHNAVSKTINFDENAKIEDIGKGIKLAYEMGCKGITIYRDKSRNVQIIESTSKKDSLQKVKKVPKVRVAILREEEVDVGKAAYVTIPFVGGRPAESFIDTNFAQGDEALILRILAIRMSRNLRSGVTLEQLANDFDKIPPGRTAVFTEGGYANTSITDAIKNCLRGRGYNYLTDKKIAKKILELEQMIQEGRVLKGGDENLLSNKEWTEGNNNPSNGNYEGIKCPDCGRPASKSGGCVFCPDCGSKCG